MLKRIGFWRCVLGALTLAGALGTTVSWAQADAVSVNGKAPTAASPGAGSKKSESSRKAQVAEASPAATVPASASEGAEAAPSSWRTVAVGLATALGLTGLASAAGWGEGAAMTLLLLVFAMLLLAAGAIWARRRSRAVGASTPSAGFTEDGGRAAGPKSGLHQARDYSPQNVGNDASARPWERQTTAFQSSRFSDTQAGAAGDNEPAAGWGVPADFDVPGFLAASKANFISLQSAWDRADIASLRAMMTDDMLGQIRAQLVERERQSPGVANVTEVVMLEAHLLGIEEGEQGYVASVEFSGLIREAVSAGPNPFREIWNITRPKSGPSGWLVAGVQALQ